MNKRKFFHFSLLLSLFILACQFEREAEGQKEERSNSDSQEEILELAENNSNEYFDAYWYRGEAEVSTYTLEQARYGEIRSGEAILIFVTEDFLINSQVKREREVEEPFRSVLKLNFLRKFPTGVYDYSLMTSIFNPVQLNKLSLPLKMSTSSQDWCGHSWMQLNRNSKGFKLSSYSYFQNEGDQQSELEKVLIEDGLWVQIRMDPALIPLGEQEVFPGSQYLRFSHRSAKAYQAIIKLEEGDSIITDDQKTNHLILEYPELERSLKIVFSADFPYEIHGWEEKRKSGFGSQAKTLITKASKKAQMLAPYWSQNGTDDAYLRGLLERKEINF